MGIRVFKIKPPQSLRLIRSISIIVPAYNEADAAAGETIRRIQSYLAGSEWIFHEILIVDDGSTDGTCGGGLGVCWKRISNVRVLRNRGNRGKGYSVRHGMLEARGEWRLFTDADLSAPIEEIERLWAAMERDDSQVAIGSRALDRSLIGVHQPGIRESAGKVFNAVMRRVVGLPDCGYAVRFLSCFQGAA